MSEGRAPRTRRQRSVAISGQPGPIRFLAVATEWFSRRGGVSTLNRSLCAALASAGHEVLCLVPEFDEEERVDAAKQHVTLVSAPKDIGLSDEARLCLPMDIEDPDVVIGHGHVTGPVAAARAARIKGASRVHVLHTSSEELEWLKERGRDAAVRSAEKQALEATLAAGASLTLAVGPRLTRQWQTFLAGGAPHVHVTRLDPGVPSAPPVVTRPPGLNCLVLGRAEDYEIKGLDIAAAALGRLRLNDPYFVGAREPVLVIRGAVPGTAQDLRRRLHAAARVGLQVNIKDYTHDASQVREDLARASVLLLPSRAEGFGLVALEALAMGVPVLVSARSGIAELLLDRAEANPSESFLRDLVVDIKDDLEIDAEAWANALATTLREREAAFAQAAALRSLLVDANYWANSVHTIVAGLPFAERPPEGSEFDQAAWWVGRDPLVAVGVASTKLESDLSRLAAIRGASNLSPRLALQLIAQHELLASADVDTAARLIQYRNQTVHGAEGVGISEDDARTYVRDVADLAERITARIKQHETVCASIVAASAEEPYPDVLIWTSEPRLRTCWVTRSDRLFSVAGERQGIFLSGGKRLWLWEDSVVPVSLANQADVSRMFEQELDFESIERQPKVAGRVQSVRLVDIESGVVAHVAGNHGEDAGLVTMLGRTVTPTFSLGTRLFFEERTHVFHFGAVHPLHGAAVSSIDLASGDSIPIWRDESEALKFRDLLAQEAIARLRADFQRDELGLEPPLKDDLIVSSYRPAYSEHGELGVDFQLTASVPYAFSDGAWGAYSRSVTVSGRELPDAVQNFGTLPNAVRWFFGTVFPATFGWTFVAPDRRDVLFDAFVSGRAVPGLVEYPLGP